VTIRFLADADLNKPITTGMLRREPAVDFRSDNIALLSLPDLDVLALAAEENRILVSHDVNTMPANFLRYTQAGGHCPGLILIPQRLEVARAIDELLLLWLASEPSEWESRLVWFPL
jgi:Domain of unknown function (DUF5615)